MKQCVRCGKEIKDKLFGKHKGTLWCDDCIMLVNMELNWEMSMPYEYYFEHHLKQIRKDRKLTENTVNTVLEN